MDVSVSTIFTAVLPVLLAAVVIANLMSVIVLLRSLGRRALLRRI